MLLLVLAFPVRATGAEVGNSGSVSPGSPRPIEPAELEGRSLREVALLRATILARAGKVFREWWLHMHFSAQPWYRPNGLDEAKLTAIDRASLRAIDRHQRAMPRAELARRRQALVDRHGYAFTDSPVALSFSPDGRMLLEGYAWDQVMLWDASSGALLHELNGSWRQTIRGPVGLGFSQDGRRALGATAGKVMVWDVTSGKAIQMFNPGIEPEAGEDGLDAVAFSPAGDRAFVVDWRGRRSLWDLATASRLGGISDRTSFDRAAFLPDGDNVLVWGINAAGAALLTTSTWKCQQRIAEHSIGPMALAPRGDVAVAWQSSWDKTHAFRFAPAGGPIHALGQVAPAMTAAFSADGRRLFVGEASGRIAVWDLASGSVRELRPPATRRVVAWEQDDKQETLMHELPLKMWIRDEVDMVRALAISPDGKRLAVGAKSVLVLDAETGRPMPDWHGHEPWTPEDSTEVILLSSALGLRPDSRWPAEHHWERSPLAEPALLDEELSARQLEGLSREELFVVRNLVHARRGRPFKSALLRDLFQATAWYKPDPTYAEARLTDADRANLRRIAAREKLLGGRMSERQFILSRERAGAEP